MKKSVCTYLRFLIKAHSNKRHASHTCTRGVFFEYVSSREMNIPRSPRLSPYPQGEIRFLIFLLNYPSPHLFICSFMHLLLFIHSLTHLFISPISHLSTYSSAYLLSCLPNFPTNFSHFLAHSPTYLSIFLYTQVSQPVHLSMESLYLCFHIFPACLSLHSILL